MSLILTERLDAEDSTIGMLYELRDEIDLNPPYQRDSDIWDMPRRRLLIDSILNGFDIPKFYFRSFVPREKIDDRVIRFAVIDGKQRLEAIWAFLDDRLTLGPEAQVSGLEDVPSTQLERMTFSELMRQNRDLGQRFIDFRLDIITVETPDLDMIEDMFLRLNEASPLNAAERRNAYGGPLPQATREFIRRPYFDQFLPYKNRRFRYQEISTKFFFFEHREGAADTKKTYLDRFAQDARVQMDGGYFESLVENADVVVSLMEDVFQHNDPLLSAVGMSSVYYLVFQRALSDGKERLLTRRLFEDFESEREENKQLAGRDEASAQYELVEFSRLAQSPNDGVALRFRRDCLLARVGYPSPSS